MMKKFLAPSAVALVLSGALHAADTGASYGARLGNVYGGYIRIAALKEACDAAVPATRAANGKAYAGWEAQHRSLLQELQRRVQEMIRANSRDQEDYVRNIGQYEGEILLRRKEYREAVLALGKEEMTGQSEGLPQSLKGPNTDLSRVYAADLMVIRARKLP